MDSILVATRPGAPRNQLPMLPARALGGEPPAFLVLLDVLSLVTSFCVAYVVAPAAKAFLLANPGVLRDVFTRLSADPGGEYRTIGDVLWVLPVMAAVALLILQGAGGYRPLVHQSRLRIVVSAWMASLGGVSAITLIVFTLRSISWSRLFILQFSVLSAVSLCAYRLLLRSYRKHRIASGFYVRNMVLIGAGQMLGRLAAHVVESTPRSQYDVVGFFKVSPHQPPITFRARDGASAVLPCLGDVRDLSALLVHHPIHEVLVVPGSASDWLSEVVETCDYFRITLRIVPEALIFGHLKDLQLIYHSDPLRLPEIVLRPIHLDSTALFIKRLIDIVVSASLLLVLSPLMALIALAIKLTTPKLPILYAWHVVGSSGRRFTGYKFSTMVEDADQRRSDLMAFNQMQGPVFKIRNDPRVTPFGRLLRKFSLNELPQLWSVLKGDMSLVGPRPAFPHELERYELWHKRKLSIRPGITCLWQVRGRNAISRFDDWVKMDLEYIDNWSLWLDFRILVRTVLTVFGGSGW